MGNTWSWVQATATTVIGALVGGAFALVMGGVILLTSWAFAIIIGIAIFIFLVVLLLSIFVFSEDKKPDDLPDFSNTALSGDFPYHASIHLNNQHICSAAFIGTYFILTVAHCVYRFVENQSEKSKLKVYLNERTVPSYSLIVYDVDNITVHPNFQAHRRAYNVAVLKVRVKVQFSFMNYGWITLYYLNCR